MRDIKKGKMAQIYTAAIILLLVEMYKLSQNSCHSRFDMVTCIKAK